MLHFESASRLYSVSWLHCRPRPRWCGLKPPWAISTWSSTRRTIRCFTPTSDNMLQYVEDNRYTSAVGSTGPTKTSCCKWAASIRTPSGRRSTIDSTQAGSTIRAGRGRAGVDDQRTLEHGRHGVARLAGRRHGRHESGRRHQQLLRQLGQQHVSGRGLHRVRGHPRYDGRSTRSWP